MRMNDLCAPLRTLRSLCQHPQGNPVNPVNPVRKMNIEINREVVAAALEKAPALRPLLTRLARAAAKGRALPKSFSVKGLDYEAQLWLERLFFLPTLRSGDGKVSGVLAPPLNEPTAWQAVLDLLLSEKDLAPKTESVEDFFRKLHWRFPEHELMLVSLATAPEVHRYLAKGENRKVWLELLINVLQYVSDSIMKPTTLSQLGSDWLNDSKALRSGPLHRQLYLMLAAHSGRIIDEREAFGTYGIFDNPYTSFVSVFAPFAFTTDDGRVFDFPHKLFKGGMVAMLPSETVQRIRKVEWFGKTKALVTSENAAPFARYVAAGRPCLYTEGYPNFAVQHLLTDFGEAGVSAEHAGDADLDGLVIARMIARVLTVTRVRAVEIAENPGDVPGFALTDEQRDRLADYVERFPEMDHVPAMRKLLERGCWYEQEAFPL